jgi:hypothetical protein
VTSHLWFLGPAAARCDCDETVVSLEVWQGARVAKHEAVEYVHRALKHSRSTLRMGAKSSGLLAVHRLLQSALEPSLEKVEYGVGFRV